MFHAPEYICVKDSEENEHLFYEMIGPNGVGEYKKEQSDHDESIHVYGNLCLILVGKS